jgi:hypothetical protein
MSDYLYEVAAGMNPGRLDPSTRLKANKALVKAGLDGNGRFDSVGQAMNAAWKGLSDFNLEPGSEVPYIGGERGTFSISLRWSNKDDPFSPRDIGNSVLYVQWYKLSPEKFEIVAYLS